MLTNYYDFITIKRLLPFLCLECKVFISKTGFPQQCRHVMMGNIKILLVIRLMLFTGSREEAQQAALLDADQFVIRKIHYWRGNPD